jgi:hypothetical protein
MTSPRKPRSQRNLRNPRTAVNRLAQEVNKIHTMEHQVIRLLHPQAYRPRITIVVLLLLLTRDNHHPILLHSRLTADNLVHILRRLLMEPRLALTAHFLDNHLTMLLSRAIIIPSNRVISNPMELIRATTILSSRVNSNLMDLIRGITIVAHRHLRLPLDNRQAHLSARQDGTLNMTKTLSVGTTSSTRLAALLGKSPVELLSVGTDQLVTTPLLRAQMQLVLLRPARRMAVVTNG